MDPPFKYLFVASKFGLICFLFDIVKMLQLHGRRQVVKPHKFLMSYDCLCVLKNGLIPIIVLSTHCNECQVAGLDADMSHVLGGLHLILCTGVLRKLMHTGNGQFYDTMLCAVCNCRDFSFCREMGFQ